MPFHVLTVALALGLAPLGSSNESAPPTTTTFAAARVEWNARNAEHLLNRAGFGARPAEIEAAVAAGQQAFVDQLLAGFVAEYEPFSVERFERPDRDELASMDEAERRERINATTAASSRSSRVGGSIGCSRVATRCASA
jgi:hypothetical protein